MVAIGIFGGNLSLADSAKSTDGVWGLRKGCRSTGVQLGMEPYKDLVTSNEEGIAGIGDVPDGRQGSSGRARWQQREIFDGAAKAGDDIHKGFVLVAPGGDGFGIGWQWGEVRKGGMLPISGAYDERDDYCCTSFMLRQGTFHFNFIASVR